MKNVKVIAETVLTMKTVFALILNYLFYFINSDVTHQGIQPNTAITP